MPGPSESHLRGGKRLGLTKTAKHTLITALLGAAVTLSAQAQPPATGGADATAAAGGTLAEVTVTGSRIPVPANITATSPITAVSSQEAQLQGQTDAIDILTSLPQNIIASNADFGNNSNPLSTPGGIATADLRGLGPQRTLVLVDGVRLGAGDPNTGNPNPAPDLDQIPTVLVERVDVVTGGASAVYGSDAMAGVINFIMKKNFQGVQIDGQFGEFMRSNGDTAIQSLENATAATNLTFSAPTGTEIYGQRRDLSMVAGSNIDDNQGNVTGYLTWHLQSPVPGSKIDYADCELVGGTDAKGNLDQLDCIGSSNSNRFIPEGVVTSAGTVAGPVGTKGNSYSVVGSSFLPWPQALSNPPQFFNSNLYEYQQRQDERWNAGFMAHVDLADWIRPYLNFSFMNDRTTETVGPSGLFQSDNPFTADNFYRVNCSNPLLSAQEAATLCTPAQITADAAAPGSVLADVNIGRRNFEGGGRQSYYEHTNYRTVFGITGSVLDAWSYDAYAQYYRTTLYNSNLNYLNLTSVGNSLIATGTAASPVCVSGPPCVPWNIFTQGGVTAAQLAYLYTPGTAYGTNNEEIAHIDLTGDLTKYNIESPWAHDGVGINIGGEHRFEALSFQPDYAELSGDLSGFSGASVAIDNSYTVDEGFVEIRAPLMQDHAFVKDLDVDAGYRYSNYSTAGTTNTYKFELQYAPTTDFRLRYSYDRAVRAPNLIELYNPQSYGQETFLGVDPCAPTVNPKTGALVAATATLAQCERTGVTAAQYGNGNTTDFIPQCISNQCGQIIGGNPRLQPEQADTYNIGITFTPTFLPGFSGSIDYYHIAFFDLIGTAPGAVLFDTCLTAGTAFDCSQVVRNHVTGALTGASPAGGGYIVQTDINTGTGLTSGIDVQFNYRQSLGPMGTLVATFNGAYLEHSITQEYPGALPYDCAGLFGDNCNTNSVNPNWRHNLRLSWETPFDKLLLSAQWRFIGATTYDNNNANPFLLFSEEGQYDYVNARIANYSYLDLSFVWPVFKQFEVRGGVTNVLDKDPPVLGDDVIGVGSANTYPTYDELGRELFIAFTAKF